MKDAIRLGDSTTHGGKVLEAFSRTDLNGEPIAGQHRNTFQETDSINEYTH